VRFWFEKQMYFDPLESDFRALQGERTADTRFSFHLNSTGT